MFIRISQWHFDATWLCITLCATSRFRRNQRPFGDIEEIDRRRVRRRALGRSPFRPGGHAEFDFYADLRSDTGVSMKHPRPHSACPPVRPRRRRPSRPLDLFSVLSERESAAAMDDADEARQLMDDLVALIEAGLVTPLEVDGETRYAAGAPDDPDGETRHAAGAPDDPDG
jgi:hypothetical protein